MAGEPGTTCRIAYDHAPAEAPAEGDLLVTSAGSCYLIGTRASRTSDAAATLRVVIRIATVAAGILVAVVGVSLIYLPAGLIVAGAAIAAAGALLEVEL